ncbi:MAG: hypothetical protein HQ523_01320 [Lentisphaerae bacterium]|nr:hypothetical protein [Lentisphaerota bacterium]
MNERWRQRIHRTGEHIASQGRAVLKSCLALTPHEQSALFVVLALVLLGLATRMAIRVLGLEF